MLTRIASRDKWRSARGLGPLESARESLMRGALAAVDVTRSTTDCTSRSDKTTALLGAPPYSDTRASAYRVRSLRMKSSWRREETGTAAWAASATLFLTIAREAWLIAGANVHSRRVASSSISRREGRGGTWTCRGGDNCTTIPLTRVSTMRREFTQSEGSKVHSLASRRSRSSCCSATHASCRRLCTRAMS